MVLSQYPSSAVTLAFGGMVLPLVPGLLSLLPKRLENRLLAPIRSSQRAYSVYMQLCWIPYQQMRTMALQAWTSSMVRGKCVWVREGGVASIVNSSALPVKAPTSTRFVAVSDTHVLHNALRRLPEGDVLIHAGDCLRRDSKRSDGRLRLQKVAKWLSSQPHPIKLLVGGNHDATLEYLERHEIDRILHGVRYAENEAVELENGIAIFLSPFSASNSPFSENRAFQSTVRAFQHALSTNAKRIDLLVTHGPPRGVLDSGVGSLAVAAASNAVKPRFHIFGHQHNAFGVAYDRTTTYINASSCDGLFALVHPPVVFDLDTSPSAETVVTWPTSVTRIHLDYARCKLNLATEYPGDHLLPADNECDTGLG